MRSGGKEIMGKPAILMIDTDADALAVCASSLRDKGFPVHSVNTAEIFAKMLGQITPGVIIIKTYAGAPLTASVMREISNHNHCRHIPVICYFADEDIYLLRRKMEDGRVEYQSIRADNLDTVLQAAVN